jgi:hypothetical protein
MHKYIFYVTYGWLTFAGTAHFLVDVVSYRLRGLRTPGPETTLYYGLHSSFALGQVVLGTLGLWLAWRAPQLLSEAAARWVSGVATLAWLAITIFFMHYWPPRINVAIFGILVILAALSSRR